jgi:hypothetical protein
MAFFLSLLMLLNSCKKLLGKEPYDPMPYSFDKPPARGDYKTISIDTSGAVLRVEVSTAGNNTIVTIEYGKTDSYGDTKTAYLRNTTAYGSTGAILTLTGLSPGTLYHYRFNAHSDYGSDVGPDAVFTTAK